MATTSAAPATPAAWVDAGDLHDNRDVPLPHPVRATLTRHAQETIRTAITADSAGAALQLPTTPRRGQVTVNGRQHQDSTPHASGMPAPGIGCER